MYLAFDIETAANEQAESFYNAKTYTPDPALSGLDEPPSKITDIKNDELRAQRLTEWAAAQADKIQRSIDGKKAADKAKAPLAWWTGKVICIGAQDEQGITYIFDDKDERKLLCSFFDLITGTYLHATLIGKSSQDFDVPFLVGRAMHHDIGIPHHFRTQEAITDVDRIFSYRGTCGQITSLQNYAWGLAIEGKAGDGSSVADWYAKGDTETIRKYCQQDVSIVAQMLARWRKPYVRLPVPTAIG